ncbi:MAG: alpha/beta hydrolase [Porphyrobacter sp.]|nr:alpha/beta hydrolase [Porphyrobacter sp.]
MPETRFHAMPDGRRIAFRHTQGSGPAIVFLPGYMSDMAGSKATALLAWAEAEGRECLLLDYSGCGESDGDFADGTLGRWTDEVLSLVETTIRGELVLVGSSMGGWLMVLVAGELGSKVIGLVGIASAPDFTGWGYDEAQKAQLSKGETVFTENAYGYDPTPTHAGFWSDGQDLRQLEREVAIDCPVRLLHGQEDTDVPPEISLRLARALRSEDVQVTLIKGGDHRLSRDSDIALLLRTVAALA